MTPGEAGKLLAVLDQLYPNTKKATNPTAQARSWALVLCDWSYRQMEAALVAFVANDKRGFPPAPGQLIETAKNLQTKGDDMTEQEAWALVQRALSNGMYGYQEEWDKLPAQVQACIGGAHQLHEWALADSSAVNTVVASNFMRSFRQKKESRDKYGRVPQYIQQISQTLFPALDEAVKPAPALTEAQEQNRKRELLQMLGNVGKAE